MTASGFFVLRTPLLPLSLLDFGDIPFEAPGALKDADGLAAALASDRARVRAKLREVVRRSDVREALFLASVSIESAVERWLRSEDQGDDAAAIERSVLRYVQRMASRPTPFGLFAGSTLGRLGAQTAIRIGPSTGWQRQTSLDSAYLSRVSAALAELPDVRRALEVRINSSAYVRDSRVYALEVTEGGGDAHHDSYRLVSFRITTGVRLLLELAREPVQLAVLVDAFVERGHRRAAAERFVGELLEGQLLVGELEPPLTSCEPLLELTERARKAAAPASAIRALETARTALSSLDSRGLGCDKESYRIGALEALGGGPPEFHVELWKSASAADLSTEVIAEIERAIAVLEQWKAPTSDRPIDRFIERFVSRYEDREVSLCEALDEDLGVEATDTAEASSLLEEVELRAGQASGRAWHPRDAALLDLVVQAARDGRSIVELPPDRVFPPHRVRLADAFAAVAALGPDGVVWLDGITGPSGARLLGRFCRNEALRIEVERHLRAEEALRPGTVMAEVVHCPGPRAGNYSRRPPLRVYEIPYLGRSAASLAHRIPVSDLRISVQGGKIVLRSAALNKVVIPRETTAYEPDTGAPRVYRFLWLMQSASEGGLRWSWGPLDSLPTLPRVVSGRVVVAPARWRVSSSELEPIVRVSGAARFTALARLRDARGLPRRLTLEQGEDGLLYDLDNIVSVDALAHAVRKNRDVVFLESAAASGAVVQGAEGAFAHELVIPFVRERTPDEPPRVAKPGHVRRTFIAGSQWVFAKLYTGPSAACRVLLEAIAPLVRELRARGAIEAWFFIRYGDPDWHLRVRLKCAGDKLHRSIIPRFYEAIQPLVDEGVIHRVQLDTYEREVERWGGAEGAILAEQLFAHDSDLAVRMIEKTTSPALVDARWRLGAFLIDRLFTAFGFDLAEKRRLAGLRRDGLVRDLGASPEGVRELDRRYRAERASLEALISNGAAPPELSGALKGMKVGVTRVARVVGRIRRLRQKGLLARDLEELAVDFAHMSINRLLQRDAVEQELVLYHLLARLYESQTARRRA